MLRMLSAISTLLLASALCAEEARSEELSFFPKTPESVYTVPDTSKSVTKQIDAETGGEIEAVASDGTKYHLTLPPNSLLYDQSIALSPLESAFGFNGSAI